MFLFSEFRSFLDSEFRACLILFLKLFLIKNFENIKNTKKVFFENPSLLVAFNVFCVFMFFSKKTNCKPLVFCVLFIFQNKKN